MMYARVASCMAALAMIAVASSAMAQQRDAEVALQQAMHAEQVEGDLERAIALYQNIVEQHGNARPVAAKALLSLGQCYEKLGRTEAMSAYQRLVREYGDQSEEAAAARTRLAALSQQAVAAAQAGPLARMILSDEETKLNNFWDMRVSPDGRYVAYTQMGSDGALYIRDLASGDTTRLAEGWNYMPVWSADGRRIAYGSRGPGAVEEVSTPMVVDVATRTSSTIPVPEGMSLEPRAWSPDNQWLACKVTRPNVGSGSLLLSLETGDTVTLARRTDRVTASFSPDGRFVAFTALVDGSHDIRVMELASGTRFRITEGPEQDRWPIWSPDSRTLIYQNENGAWAIPLAGGQPNGPARLLSDEGHDQPAGWTASGDFYYVAHNSTRKPYRIPVNPLTGESTGFPELIGRAPEEPWRFVWSPDMRSIAFSGSEEHITVVSTETATLTEFHVGPEAHASNLWWSGDGSEILFVAFQRARQGKPATVLGLNPATGAVRELLPRVEGVNRIHLSPDGRKKVFYRGAWSGRSRQLILADVAANDGVVIADESLFEGGIANWVRPEFSPDGASVLFGTVKYGEDVPEASHLWIASVATGETRKLISDGWIPYAAWHPSSQYIVYNVSNEEDGHPTYVVDVRTRERKEVTLPEGFHSNVHQWSPDGKWLGVTRNAGHIELWVVQNVLAEGNGSR